PGIKFGRHAAETSFIEGLITRADRRGADLIETAWRNGARLETWDEHVNFALWQKAIEQTTYDVAFQFRERDIHERLPWDHIDVMIDKEWFQQDWLNATELKYAQDCRAGKCHLCGVIYRERELCKSMIKNQKQGHQEEAATWEGVPEKVVERPDPVQRIRFRTGRIGEARFLSHLEVKDVWVRALRRARAPLAYSKGFHAQPRLTFATAVPVGEESLADYMDVVLTAYEEPGALRQRLAAVLPMDFRVFEAEEVPLHIDSLMSIVAGYTYELHVASAADLPARVAALNASEELRVARKTKSTRGKPGQAGRGHVVLDIRPLISELSLEAAAASQAVLRFSTTAVDGKLAKPREIIELLGLDPATTRVVKTETVLHAPELVLNEA
ncbi:MAG: DUF2344 domain-containing protein, partial [Candidatus Hydrogenedentes bacterium]|nr:DUF2344 domain-containing protein [Candidatus Hydrogenedentota bacterium]